jgi:hypothetical protein
MLKKCVSILILQCLFLLQEINCGTFKKGGLSTKWSNDGQNISIELNVDTKVIKSELVMDSMWSAIGISDDLRMVYFELFFFCYFY